MRKKLKRVVPGCPRETRTVPVAGDLVRVLATDDPLIKVGSHGVINGVIGERKNLLDVTFNYTTPYRDDKVVSASGGPVRGIKASNLRYVGKRQNTFWRFEHDIATAGGGKNFTKSVNVWEVDLSVM